MGNRRQGRVVAFQSLYRYDFTGESLEQLLDFSWMGADKLAKLEKQNADGLRFARFIIAGTLEKLKAIDRQIDRFLEHWDFSRVAKADLAILRISAYSLIYMPDIPASVTIDEAVDIAKDFGSDDSYRFVNGVLDGIRKSLIDKK
jgi:N utilization substance protein B